MIMREICEKLAYLCEKFVYLREKFNNNREILTVTNPENIIPHQFKKGHGNIGGGAKKGQKQFATILREMLKAAPEKFLVLDDAKKEYVKKLRKKGVLTMKDLISYKQLTLAANGNQRATEKVIKQIGEDVGDKLEISTTTARNISELTDEQLQAIAAGQAKFSDFVADRTAESDSDFDAERED